MAQKNKSIFMLILPATLIMVLANCSSSSGGGSNLGTSPSTGSPSSSFTGTSGTFTDERDGSTYGWVKIGNQIWMAENLNYNPANYDAYGRLYNWSEAMAVCPSGWHLPSNAEWAALISYVEKRNGCSNCAGMHLKSASGWFSSGNGLDTYGFSAMPGGNGYSSNLYYNGHYGNWWSSNEDNSNYAYFMVMGYSFKYAFYISYGKPYLFSVRCLHSD